MTNHFTYWFLSDHLNIFNFHSSRNSCSYLAYEFQNKFSPGNKCMFLSNGIPPVYLFLKSELFTIFGIFHLGELFFFFYREETKNIENNMTICICQRIHISIRFGMYFQLYNHPVSLPVFFFAVLNIRLLQ